MDMRNLVLTYFNGGFGFLAVDLALYRERVGIRRVAAGFADTSIPARNWIALQRGAHAGMRAGRPCLAKLTVRSTSSR